jgi:hypothetical protein
LQDVFPTEESRPDYICIDKGCQVLRTAVSNGSWNTWKKTSRFIVDSYHYTNHRASDELCRKYCNPAPSDGSAPNLVGQKVDKKGVVHDVREFNTQICEQLNAWLGGFESILKRMTSKNFNWFLHVMLFYHVKHVLAKSSVQPVADNHGNISEEENDSDSDSDSEDEDKESGSSSDRESSKSSEEESTSSSSGANDELLEEEDEEDEENSVDLNSDETSDDTEDTTTDSDDEVPIEMVEEEDEEEDEDEMEVDDD